MCKRVCVYYLRPIYTIVKNYISLKKVEGISYNQRN